MPQSQGEAPLELAEPSYDSSIYYHLYWSTFSTWDSYSTSKLNRSGNRNSWALWVGLVSWVLIGVLSWPARPQTPHSLEPVSSHLETSPSMTGVLSQPWTQD
jgi:hypothetical protein